ncbi:MAG: Ig-like domain-containing protein [Bacillota bacterium]|nr:Ig-like domain-containing protein [Bacillota bacterium]
MKTHLRKPLSLLLALVLALSLTAPALAAKVPVTGVTLDQTTLALTPGDKATLKAEVSPKDADDYTIEWKSLMTSVATVSSSGQVTAVKEGTTTITATVRNTGFMAMCTVTVEKDYVSAVTITPTGPESLPVGATRQLTAAVTYAHNTGKQGVVWSSADPAVATVSDTGLVTAVKEGETAVIAQSKDTDRDGRTLSALYQVTVTKADPDAADAVLTLADTAVTREIGRLQSLTLTAPKAVIRSGDKDLTNNYALTYAWTDGEGKSLSTQETLLVTPVVLLPQQYTCAVTAVSKTDSTRVLTASCVYTVNVLPGTVLGGSVTVEGGSVKLGDLKDVNGNSIPDQLSRGLAESEFTPAIPGLTHVIFDLGSVTGAEAGKLNVEAATPYVLSGEGKALADVTFLPTKAGTYEIEFTAYGETTYHGQLEIVVTGQVPPADDAIPCASSGFTFTGSDFFHSDDADPVVSMVFGTPTAGKLLRNFIKGSGTPDDGARYYTDSASQGDYHVSTLSYLPSAGYAGNVEIPVTLRTRSGKEIQETIRVNVTSKTTSAHFSDVTPDTVGSWAANAVDFAYDCGLVNGVEEGLFSPNTPMTRAMLVTVLYRAAGSPQAAVTTNFTDLTEEYYYNAVVWANVMGIVNGTSDTTFSPNDPVTRQQIAAILYRYAGATGSIPQAQGSLNAYADKDQVDAYAVTPMTWAVGKGIISGMTDTTLEPQGKATRAQVAVILHRYLIGQ